MPELLVPLLCMLLTGAPFAWRLSKSKPPREVGYKMSLADFFMASGFVVFAVLLGSLFGQDAAELLGFEGESAAIAGSSIMHVSAIILMAVFICKSDSKPSFFSDLGILRRVKIFCKGAGYLLGFFLCIVSVSALWGEFLTSLGFEVQEQPMVEYFGESEGAPRVLAFFAIAFFAPVAEELVFRGVMYGALKDKLGGVFAAVIVSAVFALIHFSLIAILPIFLLSIVLIALYERYADLTAPIAAHCAFNTIMAVMILLRGEL